MSLDEVRSMRDVQQELLTYGIPIRLIQEYKTAVTSRCARAAVEYNEFNNEIDGWTLAESAYLRAAIFASVDFGGCTD